MKGKVIKIVLIVVSILLLGFFIKYFVFFLPGMPHQKVTISLPFSKENEAQWLIPMGETINHPKTQTPRGHPGIDFIWDHPVPIIAVADGEVTNIKQDSTEGEKTWTVYVASVDYNTGYKELETYNQELKTGKKVYKQELIGYPHHAGNLPDKNPNHYQIHWEFAYNTPFSFLIDVLCPMTYFDEDARIRIEKIWQDQGDRWPYKNQFPDICSGDYKGKDQ